VRGGLPIEVDFRETLLGAEEAIRVNNVSARAVHTLLMADGWVRDGPTIAPGEERDLFHMEALLGEQNLEGLDTRIWERRNSGRGAPFRGTTEWTAGRLDVTCREPSGWVLHSLLEALALQPLTRTAWKLGFLERASSPGSGRAFNRRRVYDGRLHRQVEALPDYRAACLVAWTDSSIFPGAPSASRDQCLAVMVVELPLLRALASSHKE
jgi:hypothetical protein